MQAYDFVENYLRAIFGFVGITDIDSFNVQPMDVSLDIRKSAQRAAINDARAYVAHGDWRPAVAAEPAVLEVA